MQSHYFCEACGHVFKTSRCPVCGEEVAGPHCPSCGWREPEAEVELPQAVGRRSPEARNPAHAAHIRQEERKAMASLIEARKRHFGGVKLGPDAVEIFLNRVVERGLVKATKCDRTAGGGLFGTVCRSGVYEICREAAVELRGNTAKLKIAGWEAESGRPVPPLPEKVPCLQELGRLMAEYGIYISADHMPALRGQEVISVTQLADCLMELGLAPYPDPCTAYRQAGRRASPCHKEYRRVCAGRRARGAEELLAFKRGEGALAELYKSWDGRAEGLVAVRAVYNVKAKSKFRVAEQDFRVEAPRRCRAVRSTSNMLYIVCPEYEVKMYFNNAFVTLKSADISLPLDELKIVEGSVSMPLREAAQAPEFLSAELAFSLPRDAGAFFSVLAALSFFNADCYPERGGLACGDYAVFLKRRGSKWSARIEVRGARGEELARRLIWTSASSR